MSLFRRNTTDHSPLVPADTPATEHIYATLEHAPIDPEHVLLVGSAALALYGATLRDDSLGVPRPGDVDFVATVEHMEDLYRQKVGYERPIPHSKSTVLRIDTPVLPIDLVSRYRGGSPTAYDEKLRRTMHAASRPLADTAFRVATPHLLQRELRRRQHNDSKARQDLIALKVATRRH